MPKVASDDPSAKAMALTNNIFPILTIVIGLTLPAALSLYWTATSLAATAQQTLLLREDVQDLEDKAK